MTSNYRRLLNLLSRNDVNKMKRRYGDSMCLVTRDGKNNIRVLGRVSDILSGKWYKEQRKENVNDESERIVKTAAKLIKEAIRNFDHSTSTYYLD